MFIAWRSLVSSEAPQERNRFCPGRVSLLTERYLWRTLAAMNISLLWSETEFNCCTCKLNSPVSNDKWKCFSFRASSGHVPALTCLKPGLGTKFKQFASNSCDAKVKGHQAERTRHFDHYRFERIWDDVGD